MSGYESRFTQPCQSGYTSSPASYSFTGNQNPTQGYPEPSSEYSYGGNMTQSSNSQYSSDTSPQASFGAQTYGADPSSDLSVQLDDIYLADFTPKRNSQAQVWNSARKDPQELTCLYPGCKYTTTRQWNLDRHMNKHFPPQGELIDCPGTGWGRRGEYMDSIGRI